MTTINASKTQAHNNWFRFKAQGYILMKYDAMLRGDQLPRFWRNMFKGLEVWYLQTSEDKMPCSSQSSQNLFVRLKILNLVQW
jgi:hypothetical protein